MKEQEAAETKFTKIIDNPLSRQKFLELYF